MWLMLWAAMGTAVAASPGVSLGLAGTRGSDGLHRVQPATTLWVQQPVGEHGWFIEGEVLGTSRTDAVPGGRMQTLWLRPAALAGWKGGSSKALVHGAIGPSATLIRGGLDSDQWWVGQGVRGRWGVEVQSRWGVVIGGALGGALRGRGGDVDLTLRLGWER
jgi:hypothetical protein